MQRVMGGRWRRAAAGCLVGWAACLGAGAATAAELGADPWGVLLPPQPAWATPADAQETGACAAQTAPSAAPLTLQAAATAALCTHPQARLAWAQARAQAAQVGQRRAAYLPALNAAVSNTKDVVENRGPAGSSRSSFVAHGKNMTLSWLLWDFGGRAAGVREAEQGLLAALAGSDATVQAVLLGATQAWYEASAASASVRAARQAEDTARASLEAATTRRELGAATVVDELQARTALSQAVVARVRAQGNAATTRSALARAMGGDPRTLPLLADDPAFESPAADAAEGDVSTLMRDIDALLEEALQAHPSLRAARAQMAAAQARVDMARSELYPTVSVNFGYYLNGRPGTAFSPQDTRERLGTLTLTMPLFEGFNRRYRVQEQLATLEARRQELAGTQAQVLFEAWRQYQALQVELAAAQAARELLGNAAAAREAVAARYRAGAADIVELVTAQRDEANALQERIQALSNWRVARLRLLAHLGRLNLDGVEG